jgi:hypothetical protein
VPPLPPHPRQDVLEKMARALTEEPDADAVRRQLAREGISV